MIRKFHRYLGLLAGLFWISQALTGLVLVFQWELDDASLPGSPTTVDVRALGDRIQSVGQQLGHVSSVWATGMAANRFDIYYEDRTGVSRVLRVDAAGRALRDRSEDTLLSDGALYGTLSSFHQTLLLGTFGSWIIGLSGILLCTNLLLGLKLAWPRAGSWRRALFTKVSGPATARHYGVHRMLGLWIVLPALLIASTGVVLVFNDPLERALHALFAMPLGDLPTGPAAVTAGPPQEAPTTAVSALEVALQRYPGSRISALVMPEPEHPWWRIRLRSSGDLPRMWGMTTVFVTETGAHEMDERGARNSLARRLMNALYPLHTGQIAGITGRLALLLSGAAVLLLAWFGLRLWLSRRRQASAARCV
jgi:uncharacterized iron-regulated membrane protein